MSDSNFGSVDSQENDYVVDQSNFEFMDYFTFDQWIEQDPPSVFPNNNPVFRANKVSAGTNIHQGSSSTSREGESSKGVVKERVAFKTKTDIEILDDGFKWRKYGKKMVKNSPNPRNYYRCSTEGCPVKKRIEKDRDAPGYIITTYEGVHNHQSPF
ncbi:hypothetical protein ACFE04_017978 [Oxalis oulophora]